MIGSLLASVRIQLEATLASGVVVPWVPHLVEDGPLHTLFDRFALTETERGVLAVLLAHELCPRSRDILRELATELVADTTLDVVRRVVRSAP